jgi:zinc protease
MITVALALLLSGAPGKPEAPVIEKLKDGTAFVYVKWPGVTRTSLRFVIAAGGDDDPPDRGGLAHLLEHLIFHGTYFDTEGSMFERANAAGAYLNAHTGPWFTSYELDVANDKFADVAPHLVQHVTAPALPLVSLEREKGVVSAEHMERLDSITMMWAIDHLAFPSENRGMNVIGGKESREKITLDDIMAFHEHHYVSGNATAIVIGDVSLDDARAAIEKGLMWPPSGSRTPAEVIEPNAPSEAKNLSWVTVTAHARLVDGISKPACAAAAGLLEMRARDRLLNKEGIPSHVGGFCHRTRGHDFITLYAASTSPESSHFRDVLREVAKEGLARKPSAKEKQLVESRLRAMQAAISRSPSDLADQLMMSVSRDDMTLDEAVKEATAPMKVDWAGALKALAAAASEQKLVELHLSRFEDG